MGDRATLQVREGTEHGPVVYVHWLASDLEHILPDIAELVRVDDVAYATARLVAGLCYKSGQESALAVGVHNLEEGDRGKTPYQLAMRYDGNFHVVLYPSLGKIAFFEQDIGELPTKIMDAKFYTK